MTEAMTAVCGLSCAGCDLFKASQGDMEAAERLAGWWHSAGWLDQDKGTEDVIQTGPHCLGCRGERSKHWSANCWILQCCVDERGLQSCHECDEFACERLVAWAAQNERYTLALNRLREMREALS